MARSIKAVTLDIAPKAICKKEGHEYVVRLDGNILGKGEKSFNAWSLAHNKLTYKEPTVPYEERKARLHQSLERLWQK